jgi:uncharacterized membrane protein YkoI
MRTVCTISITLACALALALLAAACETNTMMGRQQKDEDNGKEQVVPMDQLPANVKATLMKEVGNGKVQEVERHAMDGKTVYEADVMVDGKKWEIVIREDGQLLKKQLDEEAGGDDEKNEKNEKEDKDDNGK